MKKFEEIYLHYLNELDELSQTYDELTDTDVRERLRDIIDWFFVWGHETKNFPKRFAMFSSKADKKVRTATLHFIEQEFMACYRSKAISIGITKENDQYAIAVNVEARRDLNNIPYEFKGLKIIKRIVGAIHAL